MADLSIPIESTAAPKELPLSDNPAFRFALIALATSSFLALWLVPWSRGHWLTGAVFPVAVHTATECFSIVVSAMVFAVSWHSYAPDRPSNLSVLGCCFLAVALLDGAHMLSYRGMPDLITPSSPQKAIAFWLCARLVSAFAILIVSLRPWHAFARPASRYALILSTLLGVGAIFFLQLRYPASWPVFYVEGQGPTPIKVAVEVFGISLMIVAIVRLWRHPPAGARFDSGSLIMAGALLTLCSLSLCMYTTVNDAFSLMGHVYKVAAYYYIYRLSFVAGIREPYEKLSLETSGRIAAQARATAAYARLAAVVESSEDAILTIDLDGIVRSWNDSATRMFGWTANERLGRSIDDLLPEDRRHEGPDCLARLRRGERIANLESVRLSRDGRALDLSITTSLLRGATGEVIGGSLIARDISGRKAAERVQREHLADLQSLTRQLMDLEEQLRRHLGRELHDRIGSNLTALLLGTAAVRRKLPSSGTTDLQSQLDHCEALIRDTMRNVRNVLAELRPPGLDELGLIAALRHHVGLIAAAHGELRCEIVDTGPIPRLPGPTETALFRIAQEAVNNAVKHAHASHVTVALHGDDDDAIILEIEDDGVGFDGRTPLATWGLGTVSMRERAEAIGARFTLASEPGRGTRVRVTVPARVVEGTPA